MLEVLFLGIGAAVPMPGQTNSSFLIRSDDACILVDSGPAILQQLAAVDVSPAEITHIYITHRHGDHTLGYPMLMLWWHVHASNGLPHPTVIASDITFVSLDALNHGVYGSEVANTAASMRRISLPQAESHLQLTERVHIHTLPMHHTEFAPCLGVRFEIGGKALVFTGDTFPTENVARLAAQADLLVHDSSYSHALNPEFGDGVFGHSTAQVCGRNAAAAGVKRLALVHIDAIYEGKQAVLLQEAQHECSGEVCVPIAGTLLTF